MHYITSLCTYVLGVNGVYYWPYVLGVNGVFTMLLLAICRTACLHDAQLLTLLHYNLLLPLSLSQVMNNLGAADIDARLEEQLIDGILYAFQEQTNEVNTFLFVVLFNTQSLPPFLSSLRML